MSETRAARQRMVDRTIAARGIHDPGVIRAMRTVPRHDFVPAELQAAAYEDRPLPIGNGQTISQPYVVALMAELAKVGRDTRVLDVGTGSGYQAAVLAELGAKVTSIERIAALAESARERLEPYGVDVRVGDGRLGCPDAAPFDAILIAAAAAAVPDALIDQLAPGGRLVAPVGTPDRQELILLEVTPWGGVRRRSITEVLFVPLV